LAVVRALYIVFLSCSIDILFTVKCHCFDEQINDDEMMMRYRHSYNETLIWTCALLNDAICNNPE